MANSFVQVPADSTGKKVDASSLDVGVDSVQRQRVILADNTGTSTYATILSADPAGTEGGLVVRNVPSGIQGVSNVAGTALMGVVSLAAGTANIGFLNNISATVVVAGAISLAAGTANIGFINNISATVNVAFAGGISLAAGTANIGFLNNISATVVVAGTVSLGAGAANIGIINNISATVLVAGIISLGAGTANIGFINNISASVQVATGATADFNTLASADQVQTLPIFGIALPASGGAVAGGTATNPIIIAGTVDKISATVIVAGVISLGAGAANIGIINNISATVIVAGVVSLGAGTANIGTLNNISATLSTVLAAGTANVGTINNISATIAAVLAAGTANIGFINNISATVIVAGIVSLGAGTNLIGAVSNAAGTALMGAVSLAAGTANIGFINNISATVLAVVAGYSPAIMSASHGPKCVTASTSANVTLIASPGAGANIFVTQIMCGNMSATLTRARIGTSASIATVVQPMAASGGGFVLHFDPPWMLSASEACLCSVKPDVADGFFTVNFFVK